MHIQEPSRRLQASYLLASSFVGNMIWMMHGLAVPIYAYRLGATPFEIGVIGGAIGIVYVAGPYVIGSLSDRVGHLRMVKLSFLIMSAVSLLYLLSQKPLDLILIRVVEGLAQSMFWPSVEAGVVATSSSPSKAVRKYNLSWSLGEFPGPILAGALMSFVGMRTPFMVSLGVSLTFAILGFLTVPDHEIPLARSPEVVNARTGQSFKIERIVVVLLGGFLWAFIISSMHTLFPPYGVIHGLTELEIGIISFSHALARTIFFAHTFRLAKRVSHYGMIRIMTLLMGVSALAIWGFETTPSYYLSFVLTGVFGALLYQSTLLTMVSEAPSETRGRYTGAFESVLGVGYLAGPMLSGAVAEVQLTAPYQLCAVLSIVLASVQQVIHVRVRQRRPPLEA